jgi:hypothetical protein
MWRKMNFSSSCAPRQIQAVLYSKNPSRSQLCAARQKQGQIEHNFAIRALMYNFTLFKLRPATVWYNPSFLTFPCEDCGPFSTSLEVAFERTLHFVAYSSVKKPIAMILYLFYQPHSIWSDQQATRGQFASFKQHGLPPGVNLPPPG